MKTKQQQQHDDTTKKGILLLLLLLLLLRSFQGSLTLCRQWTNWVMLPSITIMLWYYMIRY